MGVHPGLIATLKTFSPKGSKVLLQTPTYNGFYGDAHRQQTLVRKKCRSRSSTASYEMDFEAVRAQISVDTNSFILCNPQNPTGNCWSAEDLMQNRRDLPEAPRGGAGRRDPLRLRQQGPALHAVQQPAEQGRRRQQHHVQGGEQVVRPRGAQGRVVLHDQSRLPGPHQGEPPRRAQHAGHHRQPGAYTPEGEEWLNQVVEYIDGNHDFAVDYIAKNIPMVKSYKAQGTYLMWLDMTALAEKINTKQLAEQHNKAKAADAPALKPEQMLERWLVKYAKVHMNQGASYGKGGENHVRMNIATSRKTLEKALSNVANALKPATLSTAL
jgi:cysteine-S-conjugate beta-lyase